MKPYFLLPILFAIGLQSFAAVSIVIAAVPNGIVKDSYLGTVAASGGCTPYKWHLTSGSWPAGVTMHTSGDTKSITLSGTPTKAASYPFTVAVTSCDKSVAKASYKVVIQAKAVHVVDLRWNASTSNDVAGYNIYRGPDGKSWQKVNVSLAASTVYSDAAVADKSVYYYAATAIDINGHESRKSNVAKSSIP